MVVLQVPFRLLQVLALVTAPCPSVLSLSTSSIPKNPSVQVPFRLSKHLLSTLGTIQGSRAPSGHEMVKALDFPEHLPGVVKSTWKVP